MCASAAVLQLGVIIPATGGAARSDLATNLQQLAAPGGVLGMAALAVVMVFGAMHGYLGWEGVVDTALCGGLALSLLCLLRGRRLAAPIAAHVG